MVQRYANFLKRVSEPFSSKTRIASILYYTFRNHLPIKRRAVLLASGSGKPSGFVAEIIDYLVNEPNFKNITLVITGDKNLLSAIRQLRTQTVVFCAVGSMRYCFWLSVSEYLVSNNDFPIYFSRRAEQKYLYITDRASRVPKNQLGPCALSDKQKTVLHATDIFVSYRIEGLKFLKEVRLHNIWQGRILDVKGLVGKSNATIRQVVSVLCNNYFLSGEASRRSDSIRKNKILKVLIFTGSFKTNGITVSLKNLLENIDLDRYKLCLWFMDGNHTPETKSYFNKLDYRISYISTKNWLAADIGDAFKYTLQLFTLGKLTKRSLSDSLWMKEYERLFSFTDFDLVIHYSGYNKKAAQVLMNARADKIIYMHNDMLQEYEVKKNYNRMVINSFYDRAQKVVTVREGLEKSYCNKVKNISHKVHFVPNTLTNKHETLMKTDVSESLGIANSYDVSNRLLEGLAVPSVFRFVNIGRFSKEKGHIRLIDAFTEIWKNNGYCQLYIVGGDGELYEQTSEYATKTSASKNIYVAWGSNNLYPLLSKMDTFVLSSFHEGLPVVLFECLALGIPVISTDIPGPSEFLSKGYGRLVENSTAGLVAGMSIAMRCDSEKVRFNVRMYNQNAIKKFYELLDEIGKK